MKASIQNPSTLGVVLREGRVQKGLSQAEVADRLGVSQRYISEMEKGKPGILMERLFQLMRELDVKLSAEVGTTRD